MAMRTVKMGDAVSIEKPIPQGAKVICPSCGLEVTSPFQATGFKNPRIQRGECSPNIGGCGALVYFERED